MWMADQAEWLAGRSPATFHLASARGALLAQQSAAAQLARLLVVLPRAKFFLHAAAFDQFFESPQGESDGFTIVNPHPQPHCSSVDKKAPRSAAEGGTRCCVMLN